MSQQTFVLSGDPHGEMKVWPQTHSYRWVVNHFRNEYAKSHPPNARHVEVFEVTVSQSATIYTQVVVLEAKPEEEEAVES